MDAKAGAVLWTSPTSTDFAPAVANGVVYIGVDKLYAVDAKKGTVLWTYTTVKPFTDLGIRM